MVEGWQYQWYEFLLHVILIYEHIADKNGENPETIRERGLETRLNYKMATQDSAAGQSVEEGAA